MTVIKPGDLVVLRSGGPVMTVDSVNTDIFDDDKITGFLCAWFVGDKLMRARFDPAAIVSAEPAVIAPEHAEAPSPEASGEYTTVLDEMVAAMNDAAEALSDASKAPPDKPKRGAAASNAEAAPAGSRRVN